MQGLFCSAYCSIAYTAAIPLLVKSGKHAHAAGAFATSGLLWYADGTMIGELRESQLHEALKLHYAEMSGGRTEQQVAGAIVDVITPEEIIEIQTANFSSLRNKLARLLENGYRVRLVHPIAVSKRIRLLAADGATVVRERNSPQRRNYGHAAIELMRIPELIGHPGLSVELVLVSILEERVDDGSGSWRRGGVAIRGRELLEIGEMLVLDSVERYALLLPANMPPLFTHRELAAQSGMSIGQATKLSWLLRRIGILETAGKRGRALLLQLTKSKETM